MAEIAAQLPRPTGGSRVLQLLVLAAGAALVAGGVTLLRSPELASSPRSGPELRAYTYPRHHEPVLLTRAPRSAAAVAAARKASAAAAARALRARDVFDARLAAAASRGFDRGIFTSSPGGVFATADRVARWKPLIVRAARGSGISPNLVEAMVLVESSGFPDAVSGRKVGLTQLTPSVARANGLKVQRLHRRSRLLASRRSGADGRLRALPALRATVRYLMRARRTLGRADLAVASYHLGTGNLASATGGEKVSYASLYFGSAPDRNPGIWRRLNREGQAARDYYWRVLAAQRVLRLYRHDAAALSYEIHLQARKSSAEEVMHPRPTTPRFHRPREVARAWTRRELKAIPRDARATHVAIGPSFGQMAPKLGRSRRLYLGLRPDARDVLLFIGKRVHELSGARRPLILTSAVRDDMYQRKLMHVNANAARSYSIHTTGYAFDIARAYSSPRQAAAFEYVLERLEALNVIAYIREAAAIHIAVASRVSPELLRRVG
jgi:soluble lytic murein transglycosylase-like protein